MNDCVNRDYTVDRPRNPTVESPGAAVLVERQWGYALHHSVEYDGESHVTACGRRLPEWERVETPLFAAFAKTNPNHICGACHDSVAELAAEAVKQ